MTSLQQQEPKARPEFGKIFLNTSTAKNTLVNDISIYLDLSLESEHQFKERAKKNAYAKRERYETFIAIHNAKTLGTKQIEELESKFNHKLHIWFNLYNEHDVQGYDYLSGSWELNNDTLENLNANHHEDQIKLVVGDDGFFDIIWIEYDTNTKEEKEISRLSLNSKHVTHYETNTY
ncbi:MAG: hypothetical protein ACJ71K_20065 [Nitrososphaeraceae archaeon]